MKRVVSNDSLLPPRMLDLELPNVNGTKRKSSCVDCGGCLCCCECAMAAAESSEVQRVPLKPVRVHSIRLGEIEAQSVGELFDERSGKLSLPASKAPSSRSLTEASSLKSLKSQKSLVVTKLGNNGNAATIDEEEEVSSEGRLFAGGEDDPKQSPSKALPRSGGGCRHKWASNIHRVHVFTTRILRWVTHLAATNPKITVVSTFLFSFAMLAIGFFTNFEIQVENWYLWPPQTSIAKEHTQWFYYQSEFAYETSYFDMLIHAHGDNVLGVEGVRRTFEAIQAIEELDGYKNGCAWAKIFGDEYYLGQCKIHSVADFWNESLAIFEEQVSNDYEAAVAMSAPTYPSGIFVDEPRVLGKAKRVSEYGADDDSYTRLASAESYLIEFDLPWTNVTEEFEWRCLERIRQLQAEWDEDPNNKFTIEYNSQRSFGDEFFRAIVTDMPLLPFVFVIMSCFCCFVFWKRDRVRSQMLLGVGAVVCIMLSVLTTYGFLFCFGVPFTTVTTMLPFLMFGVGLDDAFIIYGSYNRTDRGLDIIERIMITIDDVGVSITLTTVTSATAFFMGVFSSIPAVSWICQYAGPAIVIDFIYQVTFFIALIVLDERRIAANKLDVCFWSEGPSNDDILPGGTFEDSADSPTHAQLTNSSDASMSDTPKPHPKLQTTDSCLFKPQRQESRKIPKINEKAHFADRFMYWFSKKLLIPRVQTFVVVLFLFVLMGSVCCATRLRQQFNYVDMVPDDSYMKDYHQAQIDYTHRSGVYTYVFFRDVDQSDPAIQDQMMNYVEDLTNSGAIDHYPVYFWLPDFKEYVASNQDTLGNMTFEAQIAEWFKDPTIDDLYGEHVVVDKEDGTVTQSRCVAFIDTDLQNVQAGTDMLTDIRAVDTRQPINHDGRARWAFLTYADDYHILEFYNVVVEELIFTTVMGVVSVSVLAFILIPHWSAVLFVFPFISFLYIDMLGFLYLAGVNINAISYITLIMAIGLMVDFIVHILLRYFESKGTREQRVVETLSTMGASILVGAISTFLGVLLLVFSTSEIIKNIFVSFIGIATFGVLHGLVFLPTILAMIGPEP